MGRGGKIGGLGGREVRGEGSWGGKREGVLGRGKRGRGFWGGEERGEKEGEGSGLTCEEQQEARHVARAPHVSGCDEAPLTTGDTAAALHWFSWHLHSHCWHSQRCLSLSPLINTKAHLFLHLLSYMKFEHMLYFIFQVLFTSIDLITHFVCKKFTLWRREFTHNLSTVQILLYAHHTPVFAHKKTSD